MLQKGDTIGVFQLESGGMQRYLKQLKPNTFEDIIAMVALYRPGPMQLIPDYIARKQKKQPVAYLHPMMKPILESTQGIMIYQEQIMKIAQQMAGFTLAEADILRKAIGKKKIGSDSFEVEYKTAGGIIRTDKYYDSELKKESYTEVLTLDDVSQKKFKKNFSDFNLMQRRAKRTISIQNGMMNPSMTRSAELKKKHYKN